MTSETKLNYCTFCGAHKDKVKKLIVSEDVAICSDCVDLCNKLMMDEEHEKLEPVVHNVSYDPESIKEFLDQHIIGQDSAKSV
jgi:ATP-dependent Clp protease ATP-binding subunit ClpX